MCKPLHKRTRQPDCAGQGGWDKKKRESDTSGNRNLQLTCQNAVEAVAEVVVLMAVRAEEMVLTAARVEAMVVVLHRKHQVIMEGVDQGGIMGDIQAVTLEVEVGDQVMVEEKNKVVGIQAVALEVKVGDQVTVAEKDKVVDILPGARAEARVRKTATTKQAVKVGRAGLARVRAGADMATRVGPARVVLVRVRAGVDMATRVGLQKAGLAREAAREVTASETSLAVSKACSPNPSLTNCTAPEIFMPCKSFIKIFVSHADLVQLHQHSWRWRMGL